MGKSPVSRNGNAQSQKNAPRHNLKKKLQFPFSEEDWANTPASVQQFLFQLLASNAAFEKRIEELEKRLNKNSQKLKQATFIRQSLRGKSRRRGKRESPKRRNAGRAFGKKMLEPTEVENIVPEACICGNTHFDNTNPYYTHQVIELPEIKMEITHFILHKGECPCCGKINKAMVPNEHQTGYGPRLSAMICTKWGR